MNNLRNEKIRSVLLALLLAVSFLILDGGIQCGYQRYWLTGDASKVDPQADMDSIELEEKLLRARMGERGVRIEEER